MDFPFDLVNVPASDGDRAKAVYEQAGFVAEHDFQVTEERRFVQLTPPGSACSNSIGTDLDEMAPGSAEGQTQPRGT